MDSVSSITIQLAKVKVFSKHKKEVKKSEKCSELSVMCRCSQVHHVRTGRADADKNAVLGDGTRNADS